MTVRPCFLLEWYHTCLILTAFDRRARPVLGMIVRVPLRMPTPGFTELTTCGWAEMVAFLMPLLRTQLARFLLFFSQFNYFSELMSLAFVIL